MKNSLETRLGIFFALALVVAVVILQLIGTTDFLRKGYHITAKFRSAQELKKGDLVKMAGVEIGYVESVKLMGGQAHVLLKINGEPKDNDIYTDSKAFIKFTGLMGQNFVAIEGGTPGSVKIQEGSIETDEQPDLSALMAELQGAAKSIGNLGKVFSTDNLSTLLGPLTDFINKNSGPVTATIANLRLVSDNLATGKGTMGRLLSSDEALYNAAYTTVTNLQYATGDLKALAAKADHMIGQADGMMAQMRNLVDDLKAGKGTLGRLATDESLFNETTNAMANLREILEKMNKGKGTLGGLINDDSFLKNAKLSLQKLDKATDGLEDQGPLSVLGLVIGSLF